MQTKIYKSRSHFANRKDKAVNGVSPEFAKRYPNYKEENQENLGCWNCIECSDCADCSNCTSCSDCYGCYGCSGCSGCSGCWNCFDCADCYRCFDCSSCVDCAGCWNCFDCADCYRCFDCSSCVGLNGHTGGYNNNSNSFIIPKIENIHQSIFKAVSDNDSLNMANWHTCDTTHCRGGWVAVLAGKEGKALEDKTSTLFAAMQIYKKSSDIKVSQSRFFDTDAEAMKDIKRCAELEIQQKKTTK